MNSTTPKEYLNWSAEAVGLIRRKYCKIPVNSCWLTAWSPAIALLRGPLFELLFFQSIMAFNKASPMGSVVSVAFSLLVGVSGLLKVWRRS